MPNKSIAGCVSWAPDIYNLAKVKGNRMLVTTATANKLIADVWFARADFAKDNPDIIEGLVRGIFDAMESLKEQTNKQAVAKLMAAGYSIPETDALNMLGDAHSTNHAENREFFLNQNNPTNFERTWNTAYFLYKRIGAGGRQGRFRPGDGFLGDPEARQRAEVRQPEERIRNAVRAGQRQHHQGRKRGDPHQDRRHSLLPQLLGPQQEGHQERGWQGREELYDPNVNVVVEEVGKLAGQFGAARIVIEGHTDSSMKGRVPESAVEELSANRANAVKEAIVRKFPTLQPNQFSASGMGWKRPARSRRSDEPRQEPARRDQGVSARGAEIAVAMRMAGDE